MESIVLTDRQKEVFEYLVRYSRDFSKPPTFREIGDAFDIKSTNGVRSLLTALEKKGFIKILPRISRGIQILSNKALEGEGVNKLEIPILGSVAAGAPVLAQENYNGTLDLDSSFIGKRRGKVFALKVRGDSMIEAGILQGDFVIVEQAANIKNGDIVVAIIDSDATVKYFFRQGDAITLEPANSKYSPLVLSPDKNELILAGKVIGIIRKY